MQNWILYVSMFPHSYTCRRFSAILKILVVCEFLSFCLVIRPCLDRICANIFCPNGYVLDEFGCGTCQCNPGNCIWYIKKTKQIRNCSQLRISDRGTKYLINIVYLGKINQNFVKFKFSKPGGLCIFTDIIFTTWANYFDIQKLSKHETQI